VNKKILLIEPNPYHTDGLPGIVQYLNDLNYIVDVYIQTQLVNDNAFCRYTRPLNLYNYEFNKIKELLNRDAVKEYDFVFFYSMEFILDGSVFNIIQYLGFIPKAKYGILGIYHTTSHIDRFHDYQLMAEGRFFCLSGFQIHNYNLSVLNPHYYGDVTADKSNDDAFVSNKRNNNSIICIGNAFDTNLLSSALYQIYKQKEYVNITYYGGTNQTPFQKTINTIKGMLVFVLSPFSHSFLKKRLLRKYIERKGRVTFETLFAALIKCKYILVLINPRSKEHEHYLEYTTSGIKQLILGFKKVPIIHEEVASIYGFDAANSILYNDMNFSSVLLSASNEKSDYNTMADSIKEMEYSIYSQSINNLKNVIARISYYVVNV
jgi:hypothetical protein